MANRRAGKIGEASVGVTKEVREQLIKMRTELAMDSVDEVLKALIAAYRNGSITESQLILSGITKIPASEGKALDREVGLVKFQELLKIQKRVTKQTLDAVRQIKETIAENKETDK